MANFDIAKRNDIIIFIFYNIGIIVFKESAMLKEQDFLTATDNGVQTVIPQSAIQQVVYLDFDGAAASYVNTALGVAIGDIAVEDSGFDSTTISVIVDALNGMFDDVSFTSELPADGDFSTIYIGVTSAFDKYGSFLGLAETIDSGNQIHDDNAFVLLDSSATAQMVVSVIAHETERIVHGMEHGGEGLHRYAANQVVSSGEVISVTSVGPGTDTLLVENGGVVSSATVHTSAVMTVNNGGVVSSATVNFNGIASVLVGGLVDNATLNNGSMYIDGVASSVYINFGALVVNTGGTASNVTIVTGGMSIGGTVESTAMSAGVVHVSGGTAIEMTMNGGNLLVYDGGLVSSITVSNGTVNVFSSSGRVFGKVYSANLFGIMNVSNGGVVEHTSVNSGGRMDVRDGGTATDTTMSGGTMIMSGGTHRGVLSIASGAVVSACSGVVIDFTVAEQADNNVPLIDRYDYIVGAGDATYTLTEASGLTAGSHALAGNAAGFNSTITVKTDDQVLGSLYVDGV